MKDFGKGRLMEFDSKWLLTDAEKDAFIDTITPNLILLRTKAEISQDELAGIVGISRQTYSAIERKIRKMSWNTYLSLLFFYDYNQKTHQLLRSLDVFPDELIKRFNDGDTLHNIDIKSFLDGADNIVDKLDEQALRSIRTMIMVEYARCADMPSDAVVKSFDGLNFGRSDVGEAEVKAQKAIKAIKDNKRK